MMPALQARGGASMRSRHDGYRDAHADRSEVPKTVNTTPANIRRTIHQETHNHPLFAFGVGSPEHPSPQVPHRFNPDPAHPAADYPL
jgi:hypothetical protein